MKWLSKFDLPPLWLALMMVLAMILAKYLPIWSFVNLRPNWLAPLITLIGIGYILWAAYSFYQYKTTIHPRARPSTLLTTGPFAHTRNPIYRGFALILAAFALWLGALSALLLVPAYIAIINQRFIKGEEEKLRALFGKEADAYIANTRRW